MIVSDKIVNKRELLKEVSTLTGLPVEECDLVYEGLVKAVRLFITNGRPVRLNGLGKFEFRKRRGGFSNLAHKVYPKHYQLVFKIVPIIARYISIETREY